MMFLIVVVMMFLMCQAMLIYLRVIRQYWVDNVCATMVVKMIASLMRPGLRLR